MEILGEFEVVRREGVLVAERDGEDGACGVVNGALHCAEKDNKRTTTQGELVEIIVYTIIVWGY